MGPFFYFSTFFDHFFLLKMDCLLLFPYKVENFFPLLKGLDFGFRDLGNSNISGPLGPELGQLKHLQFLELYRNNFEGKIPKELGDLKNLVSMDLYGNKLQGQIPKSFAKLKSIKFLRLNNNKLTGPIPRDLASLSNLKVFDVSNNDLCGTIPIDGPFSYFPLQSYDNNSRLNGPELRGLVPYDFGC